MADIAEAKERLTLFLETFEELRASWDAGRMGSATISTSWRIDMQSLEGEVTRQGVDREALKAFLLSLRFFRHKTDRINLRQMEGMIQDLPVPDTLKDAYSKNKRALNDFLDDQPTMLKVNDENGVLTRRVIFETFLYGTFSHAEGPPRQQFLEWRTAPDMFADLEAEFDLIIKQWYRVLSAMEPICLDILSQLT